MSEDFDITEFIPSDDKVCCISVDVESKTICLEMSLDYGPEMVSLNKDDVAMLAIHFGIIRR